MEILISGTSCGLKKGLPNSGLPSGTLVSQGALSAGACASGTPTVSGVVQMYDQGSGNYEANISGISYSGGGCAGTLQIEFLAGAYYGCGGSITVFGGTQNFGPCPMPTVPTEVVFHCSSLGAAPNGDCAVALLTPSG